jgi:hypothetical protein
VTRRILTTPRARWYGSVRADREGRLRFSPLAFKGQNQVHVWDRSPRSVDVFVGSRQMLLIHLWRGKVVSACFVYTLTAAELRYAVEKLRAVTGGLEGWIVPALEWMQGDPISMRPDVLQILPELLESCRDLPVSPVWQRHRRETQKGWVKRLETHPEELPMVRAPWMLPEGYNPPLMTAKPSRR